MKKVKKVTVIGAGVMGAGIAEAFIEHGFSVCLFSRQRAKVDSAVRLIEDRQAELLRKGAVSGRVVERSRKLISVTTSLDEAIQDTEFVCESIVERLQEKKELFERISHVLPASVILTTNTSSLPLSLIAPAVACPERFMGLHWMNPAHLMPMVEVIRSEGTSDATVNATCDLAKKAGKSPIVLNEDIPGFVINRLQYALFREAFYLVEKGIISPAGIDEALKSGLGLRWAVLGAFEHMDLCGLDTVHAVAGSLFEELDRSPEPPSTLKELVGAGKLGLKSGGGGYLGFVGSELERLAERRDDALVYLLRSLRRLRKTKAGSGTEQGRGATNYRSIERRTLPGERSAHD